MKVNTGKQLLIDQRREILTDLLLKCMSLRAARRHMLVTAKDCRARRKTPPDGLVNPKTGKVWEIGTLSKDAETIRREMIDRTIEKAEEKRARLECQLQLVQREAWRRAKRTKDGASYPDPDFWAILNSIKQIAALYGLEGAIKLDHTTHANADAPDFSKLSAEQLESLEAALETIEAITSQPQGAGAADE